MLQHLNVMWSHENPEQSKSVMTLFSVHRVNSSVCPGTAVFMVDDCVVEHCVLHRPVVGTSSFGCPQNAASHLNSMTG